MLWRKSDQFMAGTDFGAWACKVAYFEVLAERRRRAKDRHLFGDSLLERLSHQAVSELSNLDDRAAALEECLRRLSPSQRESLRERYRLGGSVKDVAAKSGTTPGAAAVALHRILRDTLELHPAAGWRRRGPRGRNESIRRRLSPDRRLGVGTCRSADRRGRSAASRVSDGE